MCLKINFFFHFSRGSVTSITSSPNTTRANATPPQGQPLNVLGRRRHHTGSSEEPWHQQLCTSLLKEYVQYLQSYGFRILPKQASSDSTDSFGQIGKYSLGEDASTTYLVLTFGSGAIVLKMFFLEPFFAVMLYAYDSTKVMNPPETSLHSYWLNQYIEKVAETRVMLHLHSFVHDFHLRTLGSYLAGRQLIFYRGYHLSAFLSNFTEYYRKAANFARNMIYSSTMAITNTGVSPDQLYDYLLSKEKHYNMKVMRMAPIIPDETLDMQETEYVLVRIHTCNTHHLQSVCSLMADEYEVILLVSKSDRTHHEEMNHSDDPSHGLTEEESSGAFGLIDDKTLYLKFYLILTSKRELYPNHLACINDRNDRRLMVTKAGKNLTPHYMRLIGRYRTMSTTLCPPQTPRCGSSTSRREGSSLTGSDNVSEEDLVNTAEDPTSSTVTSKASHGVGSSGGDTVATTPSSTTPSPLHINVPSQQPSSTIKTEPVNHLSYYSAYEVMMEQLLLSQAKQAQDDVSSIFKLAKVHCRRDILWARVTFVGQEDDRNKVNNFIIKCRLSILFSSI